MITPSPHVRQMVLNVLSGTAAIRNHTQPLSEVRAFSVPELNRDYRPAYCSVVAVNAPRPAKVAYLWLDKMITSIRVTIERIRHDAWCQARCVAKLPEDTGSVCVEATDQGFSLSRLGNSPPYLRLKT